MLGDLHSSTIFNPKDKNIPDVNVLFASFQLMHGRHKKFAQDYFDVMIVDEAHHSKAESYEATIKYFRTIFRYAMTATPARMDMEEISEIFGGPVYEKRLPAALVEKLLPQVDYRLYLQTDKKSVEEALGGEKPTIKLLNQRFFIGEEKAAIKRSNERVVAEIIKVMKTVEDPKVIVFCQRITHCNAIAELFIESGIRAAVVHSDIDSNEQEHRLEALKSGKLEVVIARDILNEGKDIPAVNIVASVRSTESVTIFEQQLGRGLRPGKTKLIFLDFVANCDRIQMILALRAKVGKALGVTNPAGSQGGLLGGFTIDLWPKLLPFKVTSGDIEFDVIQKDILRILGEIREDWTYENALESLRKLAAENQGALTAQIIKEGSINNLCPSHFTVMVLFGGIEKLCQELGVAGSGYKNWNRDSAFKAFSRLSKQNKGILTKDIIAKGSMQSKCPSSGIVRKLFGSMKQLCLELEIGDLSYKIWDKDSALDAFRKLANENLGVLSSKIIAKGSEQLKCPSMKIVMKLFGTVLKLCRELGVSGTGYQNWDKDSALEAFGKFANENNGCLTWALIWKGSKFSRCPSTKTALKLFGSLDNLRKELGLE